MKVCFVGAGSIGKRHIRNFRNVCNKYNEFPEVHLLRTTDRKLESDIEEALEKVVYSAEDLDENYDAIFVTNPTYRHYDTILMLNDRTDTFFVEKPVFDECTKDISKIVKPGNVYYVACPLRYTNVLQEAQKTAVKERVCSVRAISSSYLPNWRPGVDYRTTYSAHKKQGGGVKIDLIHEWDYLISIFGYPDQIYCLDGKYSDLEIDCEDVAVYIAKYRDKLLELHLDYFGRKVRRSLELRTSEHEYIFDIADSRICVDGIVTKEFSEDANDKYLKEMDYFYQLILRDVENVNDLEKAINVLKITKNFKGDDK